MATINTEADFLRALTEHPEWKSAVRAQILGEELLQLPVQFQVFVQRQLEFNGRMEEFVDQQRQFNNQVQGSIYQIQEANARQEEANARQEEANARQEEANARQEEANAQQREFNAQQREFNARFEARMDRIEGDISVVKGGHARSRGIDAAPAIADDLGLEYVRTISRAELVALARELDDTDVTTGDRRSFRDADLIIEASDGNETVYAAVEVSYTADRRDSDRAGRNARYLARLRRCLAHAVVASVRNDHALQELVDAGDIHWHQLEERDLQAA